MYRHEICILDVYLYDAKFAVVILKRVRRHRHSLLLSRSTLQLLWNDVDNMLQRTREVLHVELLVLKFDKP